MNTYYLIGIAMLIVGIYIKYTVGKRRFDRTNAYGLQQFKSYRKMAFTAFTENFLMLLTALIIGSIVVIAWGYPVNHTNDKPYGLTQPKKQ